MEQNWDFLLNVVPKYCSDWHTAMPILKHIMEIGTHNCTCKKMNISVHACVYSVTISVCIIVLALCKWPVIHTSGHWIFTVNYWMGCHGNFMHKSSPLAILNITLVGLLLTNLSSKLRVLGTKCKCQFFPYPNQSSITIIFIMQKNPRKPVAIFRDLVQFHTSLQQFLLWCTAMFSGSPYTLLPSCVDFPLISQGFSLRKCMVGFPSTVQRTGFHARSKS